MKVEHSPKVLTCQVVGMVPISVSLVPVSVPLLEMVTAPEVTRLKEPSTTDLLPLPGLCDLSIRRVDGCGSPVLGLYLEGIVSLGVHLPNPSFVRTFANSR